jgi:phosphoglycolate phosphatase-like HAD superfamily hydrolase
MDAQAPLKTFAKKHDFLVCIDSDGCAFDSMEIKHKECFIPNIIKYWDLQPVSKYARAAAEFVNLYSKQRGINRFPALISVFDLLADWPACQRRGAKIPVAQPVRDWIARETKLGNPTLKAEVAKNPDPVMVQALAWSEAVNATIADVVHDVPPFPFVRESLEKVSEWADILVCSATPGEALVREWQEHDIAKYVTVIAGQELGSKKEHIHLASGGRYDKDKIIMIGDAPGDMKAARANSALFFPINPGGEDESWELFLREAAERFHEGRYTADYEAGLIAKFETLLPELPPWKQVRSADAR